VLPEAGEDYEGSEMEVWGNMTAAKFDVVDNKDRSQISHPKNIAINVLAKNVSLRGLESAGVPYKPILRVL
jgi:hypothetical protein